jgi:DNA-binding MarR family transcriptional regulator
VPNREDPVAAFTALVLEAFRLNGLLTAAGDALTADFGLSSARWKVLGAIALAGRDLTVAQIARRMGLTRQAVQRLVNDLRAGGFVGLHDNPDHRRAALVRRTARGETAYAQIMARYDAWAAALTGGLDGAELARVGDVLRDLVRRLETRDQR